jgi:hypothetical protein
MWWLLSARYVVVATLLGVAILIIWVAATRRD